jgi:hypothetical protein
MPDMSRSQGTSALILLALAVASCNPSPRIKDILERPAEFEGKAVAVSGTVVEAANVLVLRFYKVDDGTGEIVVVTKKAVPAKGASVTARGVVHQAFAIGDEDLTILMESED